MKASHIFSFPRFWALVMKEFIQMRRDRVTFVMMNGIPLIQLILFGFAIKSYPKHLPTAVLVHGPGPAGSSVMAAIGARVHMRGGGERGRRGGWWAESGES